MTTDLYNTADVKKVRELLTKEQYDHILSELQTLPKEINQLIQFTNQRLKQ